MNNPVALLLASSPINLDNFLHLIDRYTISKDYYHFRSRGFFFFFFSLSFARSHKVEINGRSSVNSIRTQLRMFVYTFANTRDAARRIFLATFFSPVTSSTRARVALCGPQEREIKWNRGATLSREPTSISGPFVPHRFFPLRFSSTLLFSSLHFSRPLNNSPLNSLILRILMVMFYESKCLRICVFYCALFLSLSLSLSFIAKNPTSN